MATGRVGDSGREEVGFAAPTALRILSQKGTRPGWSVPYGKLPSTGRIYDEFCAFCDGVSVGKRDLRIGVTHETPGPPSACCFTSGILFSP